MVEPNDKDPRQLMLQHREFQRRAESIQQQINMVTLSTQDCQRAIDTLEDLEKENSEISTMVPIGSGSYVYAKLDNLDKIIVNIGAGISIEKPVTEAKEFLQKRKNELDNILEKMHSTLAQIAQTMQTIEAQINALQQQQKSN